MAPWIYTLALWLLFIAGQCVYILKRAAMAIRSTTNPAKTRLDFIYRNWDVLFLRMVGGILIFWTWKTWPDGFSRLLSVAHVTINLTVPLIPVVAFGMGLASDVFLDWVAQKIPALKDNLPPVNGSGGDHAS